MAVVESCSAVGECIPGTVAYPYDLVAHGQPPFPEQNRILQERTSLPPEHHVPA